MQLNTLLSRSCAGSWLRNFRLGFGLEAGRASGVRWYLDYSRVRGALETRMQLSAYYDW